MILQKRRDLGVSHQDNITAMATISTVRAAQGLELLAVNRHTTVPTVARVEVQHDIVNERCHGFLLYSRYPPYPRAKGEPKLAPASHCGESFRQQRPLRRQFCGGL